MEDTITFTGVMKDAKVTADKVSINTLGGENVSVDALRSFFGEPVTITVQLYRPPIPVEATEDYVIDYETGEVL